MNSIHYIDYLANFHPNIFRRAAPRYKLFFTAILLGGIIISRSVLWLAGIYLSVIFLVFFLRLPVFKIWLFSLYPLIFTAVFIYSSFSGVEGVLITVLRVLSVSLSVIILICTTSYPKIFHILGLALPQIVGAGLYLAYRTIFIFFDLLSDIFDALKLKGGWNLRRPFSSLEGLAGIFGFLFIRSMDLSQKMADSMRLRGFQGKIHYYEKPARARGLTEPANLLVIGLSLIILASLFFSHFRDYFLIS